MTTPLVMQCRFTGTAGRAGEAGLAVQRAIGEGCYLIEEMPLGPSTLLASHMDGEAREECLRESRERDTVARTTPTAACLTTTVMKEVNLIKY